ncbi:Rossmann-like and DUF2520 domain-containing protein [Bifidobacterium simiarum]|uniref:DUF2520 domain-containing protein n=1 Tax=Bifidobacterium simiarum TaxID=2045441 RepID=A0A2M9HFF3_9BIFI|nr:Rossmann-like and DUF2520 domain-containing protein [Bifidobacterium simiarum]PJM75541.1 hypothetical protein CSQ87_03720 [Bifidobacterium simiarum]
MRIGFIGAGRVGCALGTHLRRSALVEISGYLSRSSASARSAADALGVKAFHTLDEAVRSSDMLLITTPDDMIASVWHELREIPGLPEEGHVAGSPAVSGMSIGHCSGCLSSAVFDDAERIGVSAFSMHPMQAVSQRFAADDAGQSVDQLSGAFFALEGDRRVTEMMTQLLARLGNPNRIIRPEDKTRYHAAAVMASNLPIALWQQAVETLRGCGFTESQAREALSGMIEHNARSFCERGAKAALTGPVERADVGTVRAHLEALGAGDTGPDTGPNGSDTDGDTGLAGAVTAATVYRALSEALLPVAEAKNPNRDYGELIDLLTAADRSPQRTDHHSNRSAGGSDHPNG